MRQLTPNIILGDLLFDFVSEVEINSSWKQLTDTATLTIPRNLKLKDGGVLPNIPRGGEVAIDLGYDYDIRYEYRGYITRVDAQLPVKIHCEDEMWQLKQLKVSGSWKEVSLADMLAAIIPESIPVQPVDMNLGAFRISDVSPAKVLEVIKDQYGLRSYFQSGILYVGLAHMKTPATHTFSFQENIISSSLEYRRKEDHKIKVKAISILPDNQKLTVEFGDEDGEERTLHYYNLDQESLKATASAEADRLKADGYRGSFTTFGSPHLRHGDLVEIQDNEYPDRVGTYLVDQVITRFGQNGFKREIYLGGKV